MKIKSFHPPQRILMGPGPSDVSPRVLAAMARPTIGHLDPMFVDMMDEMKILLKYAFQTGNELTMPVSAPGSAGMETCFVNLVEPGDKVIVCQNGVFGGRMKENVERCGGVAVMVQDDWGRAVDPQKLEDALKANPDARIVAFVQAETSTGAQSDAKTLVEIAHKHDCLAIVDAVTSLGGTPVMVDEWDIDADLFRHAEMPVVHARPVAGQLQRGGAGKDQKPQEQGAELVHGSQSGDGLLGRRDQARLPPHRADQRAVRPARGAGDAAGRRTAECLVAPCQESSRAARGTGSDGTEFRGAGSGTPAATECDLRAGRRG